MLQVDFLNVGHGDCTVISHPSGRLTMIDINNSQNYDSESFTELVKEERKKADAARAWQAGLGSLFSQSPLMAGGLAPNRLQGLGALGAQPNALLQAYELGLRRCRSRCGDGAHGPDRVFAKDLPGQESCFDSF